MYKNRFVPLVFVLSLFGFAGTLKPVTKDASTFRKVISCGPGIYYSLKDLPRIKHPRLIYPDDKSDYPRVVANNNTVPAGTLKNNVLELNLEVVWSDFFL